MSICVKKVILSAFRQMLGGIVRLALRNGVSFLEFSDIAKSLYVDIAAQEYGIKGRVTNDSRIALITGLNRRDIKRIRQADSESGEPLIKGVTLMGKVLTGWYEDPLYKADDQTPRVLSLEGASPNFSDLVQTYGGDMAAVTVLREFQRSQVVEEAEPGVWRVCKRFYIPNYLANKNNAPDFVSAEAISFGGSMLVDHINTVFFNLYRQENDRPKRMELRAINPNISKKDVNDFYHFADDLSMEYLTKIDGWLTQHEVNETNPDDCERVGVGLYFIEGKDKSVSESLD